MNDKVLTIHGLKTPLNDELSHTKITSEMLDATNKTLFKYIL